MGDDRSQRQKHDPILREKKQRVAGRQKAMGERARKRADAFLTLLEKFPSASIDSLTAKLGVSEGAYKQWRKIDDMGDGRSFKHEVDRTRARSKGELRRKEPCRFNAAFRMKYFRFETHRHHQQMIDAIDSTQPGEALLILLPPEHAKTTLLEDYCTHQISQDPNIRIKYISESGGHAEKVCSRIKDRLTDRYLFREFIDDWGPFESDARRRPWRNQLFTVAQKSVDDREFTFEGVGITKRIYGSRCDLMIWDDIASTENQSDAEIEKQLEWIEQTALSRVGKEGRIICIGTRVREIDIYSKLMDQGFFDRILILPAILREPGTDGPDDPGESLWPEWWPIEDLITKRKNKMSARRWELVFMQKDSTSEGRDFPRDVIEACFDDSRAIQDPVPGCVNVAGMDPAASGFNAIVAAAVNIQTKQRHILDFWNEKGLTGDGGDIQAGIVEFIVSFCKMHRIRILVMEANSAFKLLSSSLTLRQKLTDLNVRLVIVKSGNAHGKTHELDDLAIKTELPPLFYNKMITLPGQGFSRMKMKPFVDQFVAWEPANKKLIRDIVKATQFMEEGARQVIHYQKPPKSSDKHLSPAQRKKRRRIQAPGRVSA